MKAEISWFVSTCLAHGKSWLIAAELKAQIVLLKLDGEFEVKVLQLLSPSPLLCSVMITSNLCWKNKLLGIYRNMKLS